MDAEDAYKKFISNAALTPTRDVALAFFIGYCHGTIGIRENIDALIAAFKANEPPK